MKGNEKVLSALNGLLADELTVINQYMVHSGMCYSWGYIKLHDAIRKQAMDEMHHAKWLVERILYFDGVPDVSILGKIKIGKTVSEMMSNDKSAEIAVVRKYNEAIKLAREVNDQGTVEILTKILKMEKDHVDWVEMQHALINQMGLEHYLVNQTYSMATT